MDEMEVDELNTHLRTGDLGLGQVLPSKSDYPSAFEKFMIAIAGDERCIRAIAFHERYEKGIKPSLALRSGITIRRFVDRVVTIFDGGTK